jgi:hypothetical protein
VRHALPLLAIRLRCCAAVAHRDFSKLGGGMWSETFEASIAMVDYTWASRRSACEMPLLLTALECSVQAAHGERKAPCQCSWRCRMRFGAERRVQALCSIAG